MLPSAVDEAHPAKWVNTRNPLDLSFSNDTAGSLDSGPSVWESSSFTRTGLRGGRTHHKLSTAASILASTIALVVIVTWLAFCMPRRGGRKTAQLVQRHLSGRGEDSDLNSILEGCLELREELGLSQDVSEPDEPPEAKKARLFLMLRESGEAFERRQGDNSSQLQAGARRVSRGFVASNENNAVEDSASVSLLTEPESELSTRQSVAASRGENAQTHSTGTLSPSPSSELASSLSSLPSPSAETRVAYNSTEDSETGSRGLSPEHWIQEDLGQHSTEGWDQDPQRGQSSNHHPQRIGQSGLAEYSEKRDAAVYPCTSSDNGTGGAAKDGTSTCGQQGAAEQTPRQGLVDTDSLMMQKAKGTESPAYGSGKSLFSVSLRDLLELKTKFVELTAEERIKLHPFVKLPHVYPEDIKNVFDGVGALSTKTSMSSPMLEFIALRKLFTKSSLNSDDVEQLMQNCKGLIAYAHKKLASTHRKTSPFYLVRRMATTLMVLDYLVSAIQILGDKMDTQSWWPQFSRHLAPTPKIEVKSHYSYASELMADMGKRFAAALDIYKEGKRPEPAVVVGLKREILSKLRTHCIFEHAEWIQWIQDDLDFRRSQESNIGGHQSARR
ncbi:hypothetical protein EMWEY_00018130 [Eimeria maxima]|uniref:Transmembrane protein n=1 Tax=Eimeria maxima TaxID=5804 RepID=U6MAY1_EIMMA|nr:hypothetical protein EMWEY_00018130 [Eimeria maxima]CDJ58825.1 hypothetical protein EMWEY_00018130 [Eimeria maxima]